MNTEQIKAVEKRIRQLRYNDVSCDDMLGQLDEILFTYIFS